MHANVPGPDPAMDLSVQMWKADESAAPVSPEECPEDPQAAGTDLDSCKECGPAILQPTPLAALHQLPSPACKV